MPWTKEEEEKLKQLVQSGLTYLQVSKLLKKSKNAVLGKANRLQLAYIATRKRTKNQPFFKTENYVPKVFADAPASLNMKLLDLEQNNCRYIAGDDRLFCGHKTEENSSYCEYHKTICCIPTPPLISEY